MMTSLPKGTNWSSIGFPLVGLPALANSLSAASAVVTIGASSPGCRPASTIWSPPTVGLVGAFVMAKYVAPLTASSTSVPTNKPTFRRLAFRFWRAFSRAAAPSLLVASFSNPGRTLVTTGPTFTTGAAGWGRAAC